MAAVAQQCENPAPSRAPAYFVNHGGGPMPLLNDPNHAPLIAFWKQLRQQLAAITPTPTAILVISGHYEERVVTIQSSSAPPMLYDYGGFPAEAYKFKYPAPGASPQLRQRVSDLLTGAGFQVGQDANRGYDHGAFIPLMSLWPEAKIPAFEVSLLSNMDPEQHWRLGQALAPLRDEGVLILGSGSSFHNMRAFFGASGSTKSDAQKFDNWLNDAITNPAYTPAQRKQLFVDWLKAPAARACHPREEHFLPLLVLAATNTGAAGTRIFSSHLLDHAMSDFRFD